MRKFILLSLLHVLMGQKKKKYYRQSPDDIFVYDKSGREIFRESRSAYRGHKKEKNLKFVRYAKYAAFALVLFVITVGGLAVWGLVSAIDYAGNLAQKASIAEKIAQGEETLRADWDQPAAVAIAESKTKIAQIANQSLTSEACLRRISGLLAPSTWLTVPVAAHWKNVKEACVERG